MQTSASVTLLAVICLQLILLIAFLLSSGRGKKTSNRLLASFFLLLVFNLTNGILAGTGFYIQFPRWAHLTDGIIFLWGPVLFFYAKSLVYKNFSFRKTDYLHLIPFFVFTVSFLISYHTFEADFQRKIEQAIVEQKLPIQFYVVLGSVYLHIIAYLTSAFREVKKYRARIKDQFSDLEKINLDWLVFMLGSVGFFFLFSFIHSFLALTQFRDFFEYGYMVLLGLVFIFINVIVMKGLRQPEIFAGVEMPEQKRKTPSLSQSEANEIHAKLLACMEDQKPYLDAALTIDQLASRLDISSRKLSETINGSGQNFFDFINSYRINEAKRLMDQSADARLTVLEVMYQSGFNSKSSFNTIFKTKTGLTPSAYKKQTR